MSACGTTCTYVQIHPHSQLSAVSSSPSFLTMHSYIHLKYRSENCRTMTNALYFTPIRDAKTEKLVFFHSWHGKLIRSPLPHFPPTLFNAAFSTPAFSLLSPAPKFSTLEFTAPLYHPFYTSLPLLSSSPSVLPTFFTSLSFCPPHLQPFFPLFLIFFPLPIFRIPVEANIFGIITTDQHVSCNSCCS